MYPNGEDGFTQVKSKAAVKKEKEADKALVVAQNKQAIRSFFSTGAWTQHDNTCTCPVGKLSKIDRQVNVGLHVTVNLTDLDDAAKTGGLAHARQNVAYHVTLEIGDNFYSEDNPRWRPFPGGWVGSAKDRDAVNELNAASGALESEINKALAAAEKAVRG